jgi:hypothetical protein
MRYQLFYSIFIILNEINYLSSNIISKSFNLTNKGGYLQQSNLLFQKNADIRSKAKEFVIETINQNYMYLSLMSSIYLLVLFLFLINCIWNYWEVLFFY